MRHLGLIQVENWPRRPFQFGAPHDSYIRTENVYSGASGLCMLLKMTPFPSQH